MRQTSFLAMLGVSCVAFALGGCYTQLGVIHERHRVYEEEYTEPTDGADTDTTGYTESRQRFYSDYCPPPLGFSVGVGFGAYDPWYGPWGWYDHYSSPWYHMPFWYFPGYSYPWGGYDPGWWYPHSAYYRYRDGSPTIGAGFGRSRYGATRSFGNSRRIGVSRDRSGDSRGVSGSSTPPGITRPGAARGGVSSPPLPGARVTGPSRPSSGQGTPSHGSTGARGRSGGHERGIDRPSRQPSFLPPPTRGGNTRGGGDGRSSGGERATTPAPPPPSQPASPPPPSGGDSKSGGSSRGGNRR